MASSVDTPGVPGVLARGRSQSSRGSGQDGLLAMIDESTSYVEQISMLLQESAHIETSDEAEVREIRRQKRSMRIAIFVMMACGAFYDFLAKSVYMLMPGEDKGVAGLRQNKYLTLLLTLGSFVACAVPPTVSKSNRDALVEHAELGFITKLLCPSLLDLLITGFRFVALVFLAPAVVSILKNSVQIISISVLNRMRGKKLNIKQWSSLGAALLGDVIITVADSVDWNGDKNDDPDSSSSDSKKIVGIVIICLAGMMGGVRNIIEEMILQDGHFPDGALLMVESWVSAFFVLMIAVGMGWYSEWADFGNQMKYFFTSPVVGFFLIFLVTAYGKDAGKLKVVKYASAIVAKVLALLFPFGTWVLSILGWYITKAAGGTQVGEPLLWPQSLLRLVGFLVITVSTIIFVKLKKKK